MVRYSWNLSWVEESYYGQESLILNSERMSVQGVQGSKVYPRTAINPLYCYAYTLFYPICP